MPPSLTVAYWQPFRLPVDHAHSIQILHTCRSLAEAGCRVELSVKRNPEIPVASSEEGLAWYGLEPHPQLVLRWLPTGHKGIQGFAARWRMHRVRGEGRIHYARHARLARAAAAAGNAPVVVELHKLKPEGVRAARCASGVVCITEPLRRAVARELPEGIPSITIPHGVETTRFRPPEQAGPGRLVYMGQLQEWKGVDLLLRALAELPGVPALVVGGRHGEDPQRRALQALGAELGVAERVEWTGFLRQVELPARLRRGDVGVVPSRAADGQDIACPLKLFEHMASGLPVVATDLPAIRDAVRHDENCLLFREGDAAALAAQARRALDPEVAARLAQAGLAAAAQHSYEARARAILDFLEQVRDAPSPAGPTG